MALSKKTIREQVLGARKLIGTAEMKELSFAIQRRLTDSVNFRQAETIFVYMSMAEEIGTDRIIAAAERQNKTILVPVITAKGIMRPCKLSSDTEFEKNSFGTLEPVSRDFYTGRIDLCVTPALAVDKRGYRIGYGGGYYDRFFSENGDVFKAALCFEQFFFDEHEFDAKEHDIAVDGIFTEDRTILFEK